nr:hypothetical protein [Tanacetum cinerariifolium]
MITLVNRGIFILVDRIPELVHVNFKNIYGGEKCRIAWSERKSIQDNLKCRDEDENNNDHDSRSEGNDQKRDSGDDNTQSDSEKGSDCEHETDENESGFESDHEGNEEEIEDDDEEEEDEKSKRVKRPAKKSTNALTAGVVIRKTHVKSLSKKKEKMTVEKRKGIDLLSEVALTEEAQYEEVRKKSLKEFHKTHPAGSGTVTKIAPSAAKIKPYVINEGTGAKPGEDEFIKTLSNDTNDEDETKIKDKTKRDEDEGMNYTTSQFDNDVNVRLNEPVTTDEGFIKKERTDAEMTNVHQGNENSKITLNQVIENAYVTLS